MRVVNALKSSFFCMVMVIITLAFGAQKKENKKSMLLSDTLRQEFNNYFDNVDRSALLIDNGSALEAKMASWFMNNAYFDMGRYGLLVGGDLLLAQSKLHWNNFRLLLHRRIRRGYNDFKYSWRIFELLKRKKNIKIPKSVWKCCIAGIVLEDAVQEVIEVLAGKIWINNDCYTIKPFFEVYKVQYDDLSALTQQVWQESLDEYKKKGFEGLSEANQIKKALALTK